MDGLYPRRSDKLLFLQPPACPLRRSAHPLTPGRGGRHALASRRLTPSSLERPRSWRGPAPAVARPAPWLRA